jgi:hypothetical protein
VSFCSFKLALKLCVLLGNAADSALIRTQREGTDYETVTLKWCTPRGCSASEMQNCTAMHRITPVDVNRYLSELRIK